MAEMQEEIAGSALAFGQISSRAAASGNANRLRIAEGNIAAGVQQIELEQTTQRQEIARSLAQWAGGQRAARAYRGTGGGDLGSGSATFDAATAQAADQAAIVEANAAAREVALIAANQFTPEDTVLAAIQGGVQGLNIGTQIAQALISEGEINQSQHSRTTGLGPGGIPVFQNFINTNFDTPGLDLTELFGGLFD